MGATDNNSSTPFQRVDSSDAWDNVGMPPSLRWDKSRKEMYVDFVGYMTCCPERMAELLISIGFFFLGGQVPTWWASVYDWEGSPIPYQETANGDVLVELDLNYEVLSETVPVWMLLLLGILLPVVLLLVMGVCSGPPGDAHASLCVYFLAVGMNLFITNMMKIYCGRFRPNFYGMCEFDTDAKACANDMANAHKSFPSGHSSLSFCAMTVLSLYFLGKVGLHRMPTTDTPKNYPSLITKLQAWMAFAIPLGLAVFVASSRVHDFYHHPADVVAGAAIGMVCAHFATGLWYPSVYSNLAGYPLQYLYYQDQLLPASSESVGSISL